MPKLMRCKYCGTLQDEPAGPKICAQCGGPLAWEEAPGEQSYLRVQLELDQVIVDPSQLAFGTLVGGVVVNDLSPVVPSKAEGLQEELVALLL